MLCRVGHLWLPIHHVWVLSLHHSIRRVIVWPHGVHDLLLWTCSGREQRCETCSGQCRRGFVCLCTYSCQQCPELIHIGTRYLVLSIHAVATQQLAHDKATQDQALHLRDPHCSLIATHLSEGVRRSSHTAGARNEHTHNLHVVHHPRHDAIMHIAWVHNRHALVHCHRPTGAMPS